MLRKPRCSAQEVGKGGENTADPNISTSQLSSAYQPVYEHLHRLPEPYHRCPHNTAPIWNQQLLPLTSKSARARVACEQQNNVVAWCEGIRQLACELYLNL